MWFSIGVQFGPMVGGFVKLGLATRIGVLLDRPPALRPRFNKEAEALRMSAIALTELLHRAAKSAKPIETPELTPGGAA